MHKSITRRHFVGLLGSAASLAAHGSYLSADQASQTPKIKPILGSWIGILRSECSHHHYWNDTCAGFSCNQWAFLVKEAADIGMKYLVLLSTVDAGGDKAAFFDTSLAPKAKELACDDPIEAMLTAADKYGVKFFISTGFYGGWVTEHTLLDPAFARGRFKIMAELAEKYAHHKSFYGWYLPDEPPINPYFSEKYLEAVKLHGGEARRLTPRSKILVAPFGTENAACDDKYVNQLERLDADFVAYQDVVGQLRMTPAQSAVKYEQLRKAHDKVPQRKLWADVEVFAWEKPPINMDMGAPTGILIPAPFSRVKKQLEAVSPYVDVITIYQYQGLMSPPDSKAPCGHASATKLYADYVNWLKSAHPALVKK